MPSSSSPHCRFRTIEQANGEDFEDEEEEGIYYNTDNTPYRKIIRDGGSIIVNNSQNRSR
jgi:hypothetical protein